MADPEAKLFNIQIDLNYITDKNSVITYSQNYGGTYTGSFSYVKLDWDEQTDSRLLGYNVYYSVYPLLKYKKNTTIIPKGTEHYEFSLPIYPQNIPFYFWVSMIIQTGVDINNVPITEEIILNDDEEGYTTYTWSQTDTFDTNTIDTNTQFYDTDNIFDDFETILRRIKDDRKMALQMLGIKCDVYLRRWGTQAPFGVPCACVEDKDDPDFMGGTRCPLCFGTGVLGGFYEKIETYMRFPAQPAKDFKGYIRGLSVEQSFTCWSITPPFFRTGDIIVRKIDGQRWTIKNIQLTTFRGAAITQLFDADLISQTDIKMLVSNENINKALSVLSDPRYNVSGRSSF
jgi:hypothetical protein